MSIAAAGALAAALALACAILAPFARAARFPSLAHPDARALDTAGWRRPLWQWEGARWACVGLAIVVTLAMPIPTIPLVCAAAVAPSLLARVRADEASRRARTATARLLRATEAALRSGAALPEALRRAVDACDDRLARRPFAAAVRTFELGAPLDAALASCAAAAPDRRVRMALDSLAIGVTSRLPGDRTGVLVAAAADRLAFEERVDEEIRARTNGLRLQVFMLAALVPAIALYLAVTVPSLKAVLDGPLGRTLLVPAALALELIGVVASRRAVEGALR